MICSANVTSGLLLAFPDLADVFQSALQSQCNCFENVVPTPTSNSNHMGTASASACWMYGAGFQLCAMDTVDA